MKRFLLLPLLLLLAACGDNSSSHNCTNGCCQKKTTTTTASFPDQITDDWVMSQVQKGKGYTMALLYPKDGVKEDSVRADSVLHAHLRYLFTMKKERKYMVFGPVTNNSGIDGLILMNTTDSVEARRWAEADPAFHAGHFSVKLHPWFSVPGDSILVK